MTEEELDKVIEQDEKTKDEINQEKIALENVLKTNDGNDKTHGL